VLSVEDEAVVVAFRRHTLLPLDDCLYALQAIIPNLTRAPVHRCLQRHGISRLPELEGDRPDKRKFKSDPIALRTAQGKLYLYVAIDRTSKFAFVQLVEKAPTGTARARRGRPLQDRDRAHRERHPVRGPAQEQVRSDSQVPGASLRPRLPGITASSTG
jgi:hypothetical protein